MLRSMHSAVSGLKSHQTWMDTIGNNIANVNTTAFKAGSLGFEAALSQNIKDATPATNNRGAANALQVGLGASVASAKVSYTKQGSMKRTEDKLDMMINGTSFFIVHGNNQNYYTKDGSFTLDSDGNLVMRSNGYYVYGWNSTDGRTIDTTRPLEPINFFKAIGNEVRGDNGVFSTGNITFDGNLDDNDTDISGGTGEERSVTVVDSNNNHYKMNFTFQGHGDGTYTFHTTSMTGPNGEVDIRGLEDIRLSYNYATGDFISANDNAAGIVNMYIPNIGNVNLDFSGTTALSTLKNNVTVSGTLPDWVTIDNVKIGEDNKTYLGDESRIAIPNDDGSVTEYTASRLDFGNGFRKSDLIGSGFYTTCCTCYAHYSFRFNEGQGNTLDHSGSHLIYNIDVSKATTASEVVSAIIDGINEIEEVEGDRATPYNHFTSLIKDPNNENALLVYDNREGMTSGYGFGYIGRGIAGTRTTNDRLSSIEAYADGGRRIGYDIDDSGSVYVRYDGDSGRPVLVGQIAVADFDNVFGLEKAGEDLYDTTVNAGQIHINKVTDAGGRILSGVLEASNVELSEEFSNMILAQRGFQANSRVISTSDQMLETVKNMKN